MLSIFKSQGNISTRRIVIPRIEYSHRLLQESLERAKTHYRENVSAVKGSHLLVKLIQSVAIPLTVELQEYLWLVSDLAPKVARPFKIGTYTIPATVRPDTTFYGPKCHELIQLRTGYYELGQPWREVAPVRVKVHPRTDLSMVRLTGKARHDESGLAIITLDLEALMYMYRGWYEEQNLQTQERGTIQQFVARYVLPNMLDSHLDVVWFNRLVSRVFSYTIDKTVRVPSLSLPPLDTYSEESVDKLVVAMSRRNMTWEEMLNTVELPFSGNLWNFTRLEPAPRTQSINAFEVLVANHYLPTIIKLDSLTPGRSNLSHYNELARELLRANSERWMSSVGLPTETLALLRDDT